MTRIIFKLIFLFPFLLVAQQQKEEQKELPKLDIPEITIVGKKAITLPFAKKGEYNIIDYVTPQKPDSSMLGIKQLLLASGTRHYSAIDFTEKLNGYLEAGFGNFSRVHLLGLIRYSDAVWEASLRTGYTSTSGHVKNSDGNRFSIGADFGTMINTDNEYLRSFRIVNLLDFASDKFGIYGFRDSTVRRSRQLLSFKTNLASSEFKSISINFLLGLNSFKIEDNDRFNSSVFLPEFRISSSFNVSKVSFLSKLSYETSLINYSIPTESPTLLQISLLSQTYLNENIYTSFGFKYINGTNSDGGYQRFFYPAGIIKINFGSNLKFSIWFEPDVINNSYISFMLENPFLSRELLLRYSFKPVNLGVGVDYSYKFLSLYTKLSYAKLNNAFYPFVKNEAIYLGYADVDEFKIDINGIFEITKQIKLYTNWVYNNSRMKSIKQQLFMRPEFQMQNKIEYALEFPLKVFLSADYYTKRLLEQYDSLPAYFVLGIGANTNIIKKTMMSLELNNLLNTDYDYFYGYPAPGVTLMVKFQYNF